MSCKNQTPMENASETFPVPGLTLKNLELTQLVLDDEVLRKGIAAWQTHPLWPQDFHSDLYRELEQLQIQELNPQKWDRLVDVLWDWRGIRPVTKQFVRERGLPRLAEINQQVQKIVQDHGGQPSLANVTWGEVEPLFETVRQIKGVNSPVFASKLGHFLLPAVFPVVDNEYIGVHEGYSDYWLRCQKLWQNTPLETKLELQKNLSWSIPESEQENFPWQTKIVEICLSGQKEKLKAGGGSPHVL